MAFLAGLVALLISKGVLCAGAPVTSGGNNWAVIVAGSSNYFNYRHQADACHAFQIVKEKGILEDRIITMAYDDIAYDAENPFPGKLFNKPDPNGLGVDVYGGCNIDYKGPSVTPENFLGVLSGKGVGKVLNSTAEDHVFVFFTDHGASGLLGFPSDVLHKTDLQRTLENMRTSNMFKKLVFYLESCESGSMFEGMDIPGVYALSASNAQESSWGTYCDSAAVVDHEYLGSCLGDLFSVSWMEDSDSRDVTKETLRQQFERVRDLTSLSHVMQWGDTSFVNDSVAEFVGSQQSVLTSSFNVGAANNAQSARKVDLQRLYHGYTSASTSKARLAAASKLRSQLTQQEQADWVFRRIVELIYPGDKEKQVALREGNSKPDRPECEMSAHYAVRETCAHRFDAASGFALQFHQIIVNACDVAVKELDVNVAAIAATACQDASGEEDAVEAAPISAVV
eukprot:TRINITY_DN4628_c0_g1_i2.p1 TRINITY_DN4628_c0_g1~~TRINITY_DN4628_c0_g1_i2.p1  ORF type:complete len:454 (+),score=72.48 TRINITY_DN4628_c0_g1_i2:47-1408(+)